MDWSPWVWGLNLKQISPLHAFRQADYIKFCLCRVRIYLPVIFSLFFLRPPRYYCPYYLVTCIIPFLLLGLPCTMREKVFFLFCAETLQLCEDGTYTLCEFSLQVDFSPVTMSLGSSLPFMVSGLLSPLFTLLGTSSGLLMTL